MTTKLPKRHQAVLTTEIQSELQSFGARLKGLRLQRGWTLEETACRSGLSRAFLSRLESGGRQASIAAALSLARIFDVSLASLFESAPAVEPCVIVRARELAEQEMNGLKYSPLSRSGGCFNLQPIRVKVPLTREGDEHYRHDGEEWIYLLSGSLTVSLAGKTYDLEPGDSAHFDSRLAHRLIARGKKDAEVLLVASPRPGNAPTLSGWVANAWQPRTTAVPAAMTFAPLPVGEAAVTPVKSRQFSVKPSRIKKIST